MGRKSKKSPSRWPKFTKATELVVFLGAVLILITYKMSFLGTRTVVRYTSTSDSDSEQLFDPSSSSTQFPLPTPSSPPSVISSKEERSSPSLSTGPGAPSPSSTPPPSTPSPPAPLLAVPAASSSLLSGLKYAKYLTPSTTRCKPFAPNLVANRFLCPNEPILHGTNNQFNSILASQKGGSTTLGAHVKNTLGHGDGHRYPQVWFGLMPEYIQNPAKDDYRYFINENAWQAHKAKGMQNRTYSYALVVRHPYLRTVSEFYYRTTGSAELQSPFRRQNMPFEKFVPGMADNHILKWIGPRNTCRDGQAQYNRCGGDIWCRKRAECMCNINRNREDLEKDLDDILEHILGLYAVVVPLDRLAEGMILMWAADMGLYPCSLGKAGEKNHKSKLTNDVSSIRQKYNFDDAKMNLLKKHTDLDIIVYEIVNELFELQLKVAEADPETKDLLDIIRKGEKTPCMKYQGAGHGTFVWPPPS